MTNSASTTATHHIGGFLYPFRALGVLNRHRELWRFVLVPLLINVVVGALLYAGLFVGGLQLIDRLVTGEGVLFAAIEWLLRLILLVALAVGLGFLLVRFGVVLGAPWYGQLSERLELLTRGEAPPAQPLTLRGALYDMYRALSFEAKKLLLTAPFALVLFLIGFIPAAGQVVAPVGWVVLGALIACLDFFDSALERRRLPFRRKLGLIRRSLPASAGFGLTCFGLVSIPLLNLLTIPLCVAGGTLFLCERGLLEETERKSA